MRIAFYTKLSLTFLLFGLIILLLSFFLSMGFFKTNSERLNLQNMERTIHGYERAFRHFIITYDNKIKAIAKSRDFKEYLANGSNEKDIVDLFKTAVNANYDLKEIKVINSQGEEILRVGQSNSEATQFSQFYLENRSSESYFYHLVNLQENEVWHSGFDLNRQQGEIVYPIEPLFYLAIKYKNHILMMHLDAHAMFRNLLNAFDKRFYLVSSQGDFLLHKEEKYHWSKYFYPAVTLQNSFPKEFRSILSNEQFISKKLFSQKIYFDDEAYIIFMMEFDQTTFEEMFHAYKDIFYIVMIITLVVGIFLAMIFSIPVDKLHQELENEKKQLSRSVEKNAQKLDSSLKLVDKYVMYIKFDTNKKILDVSSSFCFVSGFEKEELLGHSYEMLLSSQEELASFEKVFTILKTGKKWHGEFKNIKKSGISYWVESFLEANFNENGEITSFLEIRNNITYRKTVQSLYDNIHNQMEELNAIFENVDSGIVLLDEKANYKKVNTAFCDLLQYSKDELLSMNLLELLQKQRKSFFTKIFVEAKHIGTIRQMETVLLSKYGVEVYLSISLRMLPDNQHMVLVANSLADKRKLQALNKDLELRISQEVQKSLYKDKLHQEEKIRNAKLTSIGTLAAGITHEINTPLTYLKGNFEMMQYDIDDLPASQIKDNMKEDSLRISEAITRIANIVESMREMSQTSSETKEKINLYSTIITALTMAYNRSKQVSRIILNGKLFSLETSAKDTYEFFVHGQKQRIEQVWVVIINNAIDELIKIDDYEKRLLTIDIFTQESKTIVRFKDNAGGIDASLLPKIFDPFVSTKEHSGMGVGLNIAKKIIDEQGGELLAFNEADGAVFEVRLTSSS